MKTFRLTLPTLSCLALSFSLAAQPLLPLQQIQEQYQGELAVYLLEDEQVVVDLKGADIVSTSTRNEDLLLLNDMANLFSEKKIYYSSHFNSISNISARTLVPDQKKYKGLQVKNFKENQESSSWIFYDDIKSISFRYPSLGPGSRAVLKYDRSITEPRLLQSYIFGAPVPTEESKLSITVNNDVILNYKLFNTESTDIQETITKTRKYTTYTWHVKGLPGRQYEADGPGFRHYAPHIVYYIGGMTHGGNSHRILNNLDDLYSWYMTLISDVMDAPGDDQQMRFLVDSLAQQAATPRDLAKSIYYWVQDNVRYVAFEDGYRGFIPYHGLEVYRKRYGDCKDMSSIIYSMMQIAGLNTYLTWIGTRELPYRYTELPTPAVDNHMIATFIDEDGSIVFLDATSRYTPFGYPTSMIQGKEALIGIDNKTYRVEEVPVMEMDRSRSIDSITLDIDNRTIQFTATNSIDGYFKAIHTRRLSGITQQKQKEMLTRLLERGNNKFYLDSVRIENLDNKDLPLKVDYEGRISDYVLAVGDEIYVNMNLDKLYANDLIDTLKRKVPIENEFKFTVSNYIALNIPEGYSVKHLPESVSFSHELFGFEINYSVQNGQVVSNSKVYMNHLMLYATDFNEWNRMVRLLSQAYRDSLILIKTI